MGPSHWVQADLRADMAALRTDVATLAERQDKGYKELLAEIRLITAPQGQEGASPPACGSPADAASAQKAAGDQRGGVGLTFKV
jgi:hypothetical protein